MRFSCIFHTCFMGSQHSSKETRGRAKALAADIGSYHIDMNIDTVVSALTALFTAVTNFQPRFAVHGGTYAENAALQNIQARIRMVLSYMFAQLLPTVRKRPGAGGLLVVSGDPLPEMCAVSESNSLPAWLGERGRKVWFCAIVTDLIITNRIISLRGYLTKYDCSSADVSA